MNWENKVSGTIHWLLLLHTAWSHRTLCVCVSGAGLRQILTDVIEEVRQSINPDINGAEVLHSLLNAAWLQSLLRV